MSVPEDYLADFLPDVPQAPKGVIPFAGQASHVGVEPLTGVRKYVGQFARGASLGLGGDPRPPEGVAQTITEMAGSMLPYAGLGAVTGPLAAATPLLRTYPVIAGLTADAAAGAIGGTVHAAATGGDKTMEALAGAGLNVAARLAWNKWIQASRGRMTPELAAEAAAARAAGLPPPGPPGMAPPAAPGSRQWPSGHPTGPSQTVHPMGPGTPIPTAPGAPAPGPLAPAPTIPLGPTRPTFGPGSLVSEQLPLIDYSGPSQMNLPTDIMSNGRINRYATPTRYRGQFATAQLAALESDAAAQAAIGEGVQSVRVTTSVVSPGGGPPTGGVIRSYVSDGGRAVLASERAINAGALKAASQGATPMRRVNPDWFEVQWDDRLQSDVMVPRGPHVEMGLDMARGIDPVQSTFPLSPVQTTFLRSAEGRLIREKIDLNAKILTADDVMKMTEADARKALVDSDVAPLLKGTARIEPAPEALQARNVLASLGVDETRLGEFLQGIPFNLPPQAKAQMLEQWLQSICATQTTTPAQGAA